MGRKGFIKSFLKFLFLIFAGGTGLILIWSILLIPGRMIHFENEVRSLATAVELTTITYLAIKILGRYGLKLSEKLLSMISAAFKTSIIFYITGLAVLLAGFVRFYGIVGFAGATLYSLTNNLGIGSFSLSEYFNRTYIIPVPSINPLSELPLSLCTPPGEGVMVTFNIHLGAEAKSWISFKLKWIQLLSKTLREYVKRLVLVLCSESYSSRKVGKQFPDIRCHLSRKMSRGYLLDSSKPIEETLKIFSNIGRKGVDVSLHFAWLRTKNGIVARHILLASSNNLKAFSRLETDLIRKVPLIDFVKVDTAIFAIRKIDDRALLKQVGEIYLRNVVPLGLSYELGTVADRITLRDYVEEREARPLSLPFPEGHALLVGGKSSGKTRFARSLVFAFNELDVVTLVIDPNGEYGELINEVGSSHLNPLKQPKDVDALTHSGSLLVFSPTMASIFTSDDPQEKVLEVVRLEDPSFRGLLLEIEGKVDEESVRLRKAISQLIEETNIDEVVRKISLPPPTQNLIRVQVPAHNEKAASFLTELLLAWGASLAISKQTGKVVMVIEDADELLKTKDVAKLLGYARDYGLSLILISRNFEDLVALGTCFSIIVGFGISKEHDLPAFQKLIGVRSEEPEGLQLEATVSSLKRGEGIVFLEGGFELLRVRPLETQRDVITVGR